MRIIRGKYGRRRFDVPKNITARPTTDFARENIFNVLENMIDFEGASALDLFAGTGAVSWEFVSRGCSAVVSVEKAPVQSSFILKVKAELHDDVLQPVRGDVFRYLGQVEKPFSVIFADPPYDMADFDRVPVAVMSSKAYGAGSVFVLEHSGRKDFSHLPGFVEKRVYGSVNFSVFVADGGDEALSGGVSNDGE